jgi:hypothetical protein
MDTKQKSSICMQETFVFMDSTEHSSYFLKVFLQFHSRQEKTSQSETPYFMSFHIATWK